MKKNKEIMEEVSYILEQSGLCETTIRSKRSALDVLFRNIEYLNVNNINGFLDKFISRRTGRKLGPHGQNRYIMALKWYLGRTESFGDTSALLSDLKLRRKPKSPGKVINEAAFNEILDVMENDEQRLPYKLMYETGMRPHELSSLKVEDIKKFKKSNGDPLSRNMFIISIPRENPVTPSGKNKTGSRDVFVVDNYTMMN